MKGYSSEAVRLSVSSVPSSSSQGSGQDDFDILGDIFMWGEGIGEDGILGGGSFKVGSMASPKMDALIPKALGSALLLDAQQIACGGRHAALVSRQGEIFCWGEESGGCLGHGIDLDASHPQLVEGLMNTTVEFVTCGDYHTCALSLSGELYTWGDGTHNLGILGHGNNRSHWTPKKVGGPLEGVRVSHVSCGPWHTALVTSSGQLFSFGKGAFGVLGHGDRNDLLLPREVEYLKGLKTIRVACGMWHTAAVIEVMVGSAKMSNCLSGKLFTWGDGDKGRLGHGDREPKLVPTCVSALIEHDFKQVACGQTLTVALSMAGQVFTMGNSVFGQLGDPFAEGKLPVCVQGRLRDAFVEEIGCGAYHVAVLTSKAEVYTWGKGTNGRLGHGDVENRNTPTLVEALKDKHVKSVACGSSFTATICLHKWVSGAEQSQCASCRQPFSFTRKRHNCYNCGVVVCNSCSSRKTYRASMAPDPSKPYRVCDSCYVKLKKFIEPGVSGYIDTNKRKRHSDSKEKSEKLEGKFAASQAVLFTPGSQSDGKNLSKPGRRVDPSGRLLAPAIVGLLPWSEPSASSSLDHVGGTRHSTSVQSGKQSRSASPLSGRSSPPRSTTPTPTLRGLTTPKAIVEELKATNESLTRELLKLRTQVESITLQNQLQASELQQSKKRAQDALELVAKESAKCKAAKEVIKSLSVQMKDAMERLGTGGVRIDAVSFENAENGLHSSVSLDSPLKSNGARLDSDFNNEANISENHIGSARSTNATATDLKAIRDSTGNGEEGPHTVVSDGACLQDHLRNVGGHASVLNSSSGIDDSQHMCENGDEERVDTRTEWVEQDKPGVFITLKSLPDASKDIKRVRFSRKRFTEKQAEIWWAENRARVFAKYNVRNIEKAARALSIKDRAMDSHGDPSNTS